jgi:hypothetical protein
LACFKLPEGNVKGIDPIFMKECKMLKFLRKTKEGFKEDEHLKGLRGLFLSEYHYFVLMEESLSVFSRITERLIKYVDVWQRPSPLDRIA